MMTPPRRRRALTTPDALEGSPDAPTLYSRAGALTVLDGSDRHPTDAELFALAGRSAPSRAGDTTGRTRPGTSAQIRRAMTALAGGLDYVPDVPGSHAKPGKGSVLEPVAASRIIPEESERLASLVERGEIMPPPYDQRMLVAAYEESDTLPPVIEAMATGTSGHGLTVDPTYPKTAEDGTAMEAPPGANSQRDDVELFLAALAPRIGLAKLMHMADTDTEITGNGYLEGVRDSRGLPAALHHLPAYTMRLGPESDPIEVRIPVRHPRTNEIVQLLRYERFRTYVQVRGAEVRYFKAYGDPRHLNRFTGQYRAPGAGPWGADLRSGTALDASEVFHLSIYNPRSSYGAPRWIGAMPHVRSGRSAAELIVRWFDGAPIGAKLLLVSGGSVKEGNLDTALDQVDAIARGEENAFSIISIEAQTDPGAASGDMLSETSGQRANITVQDLAFVPPEGVYQGDGNMIDGARKRVRSQFRLGPIHTGESDDYSHAAASAATAQAENSVFVPLRNQRWNPIFATLLVERGINLYSVTVKGANTTDHAEIAKGIAGIVAGGGASPNQLIRLMNTITSQSQALITEPWGDRPMALTQALLTLKVDPNLPLGEALDAAKKEAQAQADAIAAGQGAGAAPGGAQPGDGNNLPPDVATRVLLAAHTAVQAGDDVGAAIVRALDASADLRARRASAEELALLLLGRG